MTMTKKEFLDRKKLREIRSKRIKGQHISVIVEDEAQDFDVLDKKSCKALEELKRDLEQHKKDGVEIYCGMKNPNLFTKSKKESKPVDLKNSKGEVFGFMM